MEGSGCISDYIKGEDNNQYTWSNRAFKEWKKKFKRKYFETHGRSFKDDFQDSGDREAVYKRIFGMEGIDVFGNGDINRTQDRKISTLRLQVVYSVKELI